MSSPRTTPIAVERAIVSELRALLGSEGLHTEKGMHVNDVRSIRDGDAAVVEIRFRHVARPGASFVVRFSLSDGELVSTDEKWDDDASLSAATVIWANIVEIAALPDDYLPLRFGRGDIEVVA